MGNILIILLVVVSIIIGIFIDRKIFKVHSCIWLPFLTILGLLIPILITLLVKDIVNIKPLKFNIVGTPDGWLGFLGAIVGIAGIWWQVTRHERKEKEKENREIVTLLKYFLKKNKEKNILFELQRELTLTTIYTKKKHYYNLPYEFITNNISNIISFPHGEDIMEINDDIEFLLEEREKYLILSRKAYNSYNFKRVPLRSSLRTTNKYLNGELEILISLSELIGIFLSDTDSLGLISKVIYLKTLIDSYDTFSPLVLLEGEKQLITLFDDLNDEISEIVEIDEIEPLKDYIEIINLNIKSNKLYEKIKEKHLKRDVITLYDFLIKFYEIELNKGENLKKVFKLLTSIEGKINITTEDKIEISKKMINELSNLLALYGKNLINISISKDEKKIEEAETCMNLSILINNINSTGIKIYENAKKYHEKF